MWLSRPRASPCIALPNREVARPLSPRGSESEAHPRSVNDRAIRLRREQIVDGPGMRTVGRVADALIAREQIERHAIPRHGDDSIHAVEPCPGRNPRAETAQ